MSAETADVAVDPGRVRVEVTRTRDEEFVAFVHDAGPYLYKTAFLLAGDAHRAEELVQATFERTFRAWERARAGEPRAYARRILVNLRVDGWRRSRHEVLPGDALPVRATADPATAVDVRDAVVRALAQVPLTQRRVVVLRHLLDLSEAEVAAELRIALGTVKSANSRALARLRVILDGGAA